jgi:hypothetical protein
MMWNKHAYGALGVLIMLSFTAVPVGAVPTFQVYLIGGTANDFGADAPTWMTGNNTFDLLLVGAYNNTESLQYGTLVVSVPQGQSGTITISSPATLLTLTRTTPSGGNPGADADVDLLTNVAGDDGFATKAALPGNFGNPWPFQDGVSDFLLWDVGDFPSADLEPIKDYSAETGIADTGQQGVMKTVTVTITGFSMAHFDLYGYEQKINGADAWQINPCNHDGGFLTPAPGALFLGALGAGFLSLLRVRRML